MFRTRRVEQDNGFLNKWLVMGGVISLIIFLVNLVELGSFILSNSEKDERQNDQVVIVRKMAQVEDCVLSQVRIRIGLFTWNEYRVIRCEKDGSVSIIRE